MYSKYRGESIKDIDRISIGRRTGYDVKKWRFPLTTVCPEPTCQRLCRTRELAINHYKVRHADESVLCSVCEKPYSVDIFVPHFTDAHPGYYVPIPTPRNTTARASTSRHSSAQRQPDQEYIVTLSDGNEWQFPRITWCPYRACSKSYKSRKDAMDHYLQQHAQTLVLCTLCEPQKPITNYVIPLHYATAHPGAEVSPDWKDQMKQECEVCHKILSSRQSYLQHKATQHHIGKYKCPHYDCDHTENDRFRIETHWEKRHAHTSMKRLYDLGKFHPFKSYTKKQAWPSKVMKRKRARRVTRSTTESSVASTSDESDSTMTTAQSNRSAARKKNKRKSIIDDPKLFLRSSVQLTRLSMGKWTVQSNVPEKEPEATATAAPAQENVHQQWTVPSNNVPEKEPEEASAAPTHQPNVQVNDSAQTSKSMDVESTVQPLAPSKPQAGSSQNGNDLVFIKTELPDYLEDVTCLDDNDSDVDTVDLDQTDTEEEDDFILISD